jgi:hypothetical protein
MNRSSIVFRPRLRRIGRSILEISAPLCTALIIAAVYNRQKIGPGKVPFSDAGAYIFRCTESCVYRYFDISYYPWTDMMLVPRVGDAPKIALWIGHLEN